MLNIKKLRFMFVSLVLVAVTYALSESCLAANLSSTAILRSVLFLALITITSSLFVQYTEGGDKNFKIVFFAGLTPFLLILGSFLFFVYYPNVSIFIKILAALFNAALLYTLLLLNNVVLVVESREASIPVYRVAVSWVQIVLLSIALPLFTAFFKTPLHPILQVGLITFTAFIFYGYLTWVYSSDRDVKLVQGYREVTLGVAFSLLIGWAAFCTLFFAAESLLRGLFISSVFLLGLSYIQLYLRNSLSRKIIRDYLLISAAFLLIVVVFKP